MDCGQADVRSNARLVDFVRAVHPGQRISVQRQTVPFAGSFSNAFKMIVQRFGQIRADGAQRAAAPWCRSTASVIVRMGKGKRLRSVRTQDSQE
jgi:hypothetical protein